MECNKDEAIRAKDIAVRKFKEKDFNGAKKFALKAQTLYPGLEGIAQMLVTFDVHISAENKISGEMDMYGILDVNPLADVDTIKKQYRRLLLMLHPDKNKTEGAGEALQFVREAFNVLSDKLKRDAHNTKRHIKMAQRVPSQAGFPFGPSNPRQSQHQFSTQSSGSASRSSAGRTADQKVPSQGGASAASRAAEQTVKNPSTSGSAAVPSGVNGNHKTPSSSGTRGRPKKTAPQKASQQFQSIFEKSDTFWTICHRCKMQYEYMRLYLNQMLKCQNCQLGFLALEIPPPSNLAPLKPGAHQQQSFSSSKPRVSGLNDLPNKANARWNFHNGPASMPSAHAQPANGSQLVNENLKREREEAQDSGKLERNNNLDFGVREEGSSKRVKQMHAYFVRNIGSGVSTPFGTGAGLGNAVGSSKMSAGAGRENVFPEYGMKAHVTREVSIREVKNVLTRKGFLEISKGMMRWNFARREKAAAEENARAKSKQRPQSNLAKSLQEAKTNNDPSAAAAVTQEAPQFSVPDPDFHVFDSDRSEHCFAENQVWATYDDSDGMPRFYALIQGVISLNPFKVKISWLNSKSFEFGPMDWAAHGFVKSCGDFKVGKHATNNVLNSFSHKIKWVKGPRGVIQIYPREGEIWALYKNWSPNWDQGTARQVLNAYDMVEVLHDYNEETGVYVAPLVKVAGFLSVFCKEQDVVKHIPKEEMFRFSHQVPSHILTGDEKPNPLKGRVPSNPPKGFVELDPAATPADLLEVGEATDQEQVPGLCKTTEAESTKQQQ